MSALAYAEPDELSPVVAGLFGPQVAAVRRYGELLATTGIEWGLIGPAERDRVWQRHILNSAAVAALLRPGSSVIDVGSGAGLPGIPLALADPSAHIVLLEHLLRRTRFLELVVAELDLADRVAVVRARAEDYRSQADVVVARAVKALPSLIELSRRLWRQGELLALKGERAQSEIAQAEDFLRRQGLVAALLRCPVGPGLEPTTVVRVRPAAE